MSGGTPDFLAAILARKRVEIAERRQARSDAELERQAQQLPSRPSLFEALSPPGGPSRVIAEVKRRSPSVGAIAEIDAPALGRRYEGGGAAAISVLTDGPGFGGALEDLEAVSGAVGIPCLRKDFVLDRYQLLEARCAGASAALLIVAALAPAELRALLGGCEALGLDALVEIHDEAELEIAAAAGARLIGINNRNLHTFVVDLAVSEVLLPKVPGDRRAVVESGVKSLEDARRLRSAGASNFLIGEALVRAPDPAALLRGIGELA